MNQFNISKINSFLNSGFDESEQTDLFWNSNISLEREQIIVKSKNEILHLLDNQFDETIHYIKQLRDSTGKEVVLALSGGVDSMIIYQLLSKSGIAFKAINIGYDQGFNEVESIKKYIEEGKNIEYKKFPSIGSLDNLDAINFKYLVSHPTLISYYNLISSLEDNSILITGDLADEIFGLDTRPIEEQRDRIFKNEDLKQIFKSNILSGENIEPSIKYTDVILPDIDVGYNNITYKMISNCMVSKDIMYYPFFSSFYKFIKGISDFGINDVEKSYLKNYLSDKLGVKYDNKKQGFKYPILDNIIEEYVDYIKKNNGVNGFVVNMRYIEDNIMKETIKAKRRKLFTLVVLLKLIKDNDCRLFANQKII